MTRKLERKNDGWSAYLIGQYRFYIYLSLKPILHNEASHFNISKDDFDKTANDAIDSFEGENKFDGGNNQKSKMIAESVAREEVIRIFSDSNPMVNTFEVLSNGSFGRSYRTTFKEYLILKKRIIDAQRISEQHIVDLYFTPTIFNSVTLAITDVLTFFITTTISKHNSIQQTA